MRTFSLIRGLTFAVTVAISIIPHVFGTPPLTKFNIGEPAIVNIEQNRVTIEWTTSLKSSSKIEFGITPTLGKIKTDKPFSTGHTLTLNHLKPDTHYFFKIISKDESGHLSATNLYTFKTEKFQESDETILKIISPPQVTHLSPRKVIISWETNKPSASHITYGPKKQKKPLIAFSEIKTTVHIITLADLIPHTRYFYQVKSTDTAGKTAASSYSSFLTKAAGKFETRPLITEGPSIAIRRTHTLKIEWSTDRPCKSSISWGKIPVASFHTKKSINQNFSTSHSIDLEGLEKGKRYYYIIYLEDIDGRKNKSEVFSVKSGTFD